MADSFVPDQAQGAQDSFVPDAKTDSFVADEKPSLSVIDVLKNSRLGLAAKGVVNVAQAAAPYLEPLRTPDVGLGGLIAGAKAVAGGQDFLPAAAQSIESRTGTGHELTDSFIPDSHPMAKAIVGTIAEIATDPTTYLAGPAIEAIAKLKPVLSGAEASKATTVASEAEKLSPAEKIIDQAPPKLMPEDVVLPHESSAFSTAKEPIPGAVPTPEARAASTASKFINLDRLRDESAKQVIAGLSNDPAFVEAVMKQKRGVIPLAQSKAAGEALGLAKEDFAALKPGQLPKRGTLDAQTAAASAMQNMAGNDLYEVAKLRAAGTPLEELTERIANNYRAIVGAQGVISESGRALQATKLSDLDRAMARVANGAFAERIAEDPVKLDAFLKEISQLPHDAIAQRIIATKKLLPEDHGFIARFLEARASGLLTNPVTYLRNFAGNSLAVMSNLVERPLAGYVDFLSSKVTGRPQEIAIGEGLANSYGMWNAIGNGARDALDVLINERSLKGFGSEFALGSGATPGLIGKAIRLPFSILNATDTFFKTILGSAEIHRLAFRQAAIDEGLTGLARAKRAAELAANPSQEMVKSAISTAKDFTFQSDLTGALAKFQGMLQQRDAIGVTSKFFIPFFKTPVNIAKFSIERTPILSELTDRGVFRTAFLKDGATKAQVSEAIARNLVGASAITGGAIALRSNEGRITGGPPINQAERENLMATGWRPYSIKMGDLYLSYRGFEPAASYLGAISDWARIVRENPNAAAAKVVPGVLASAVKNFINQPFLQNIKDVLDVLDANDDKGMKQKLAAIAKNQASSLVPTGLSEIDRRMDKTIRNPETLVEAMMAKTPILSERVRPKLSRFGEPIQRTSYFFGLMDKPAAKSDPVEGTLRLLEVPRIVGFPSQYINGRAMSKDEYNQLLSAQGKDIHEDLKKLVAIPEFSSAPPMQKILTIKKIVDKYRTGLVIDQDGNSDYPLMGINLIRPKVEMRALGIDQKLAPEELLALNKRIISVDYFYLKEPDRRKVLKQFITQLKNSSR